MKQKKPVDTKEFKETKETKETKNNKETKDTIETKETNKYRGQSPPYLGLTTLCNILERPPTIWHGLK